MRLATVPTLPSIEVISVTSERLAHALVKHEISIEATRSRTRPKTAPTKRSMASCRPSGAALATLSRRYDLVLTLPPDRTHVVVALEGTRWSVSANGANGVIRGASVRLSCEVDE